MPKASALAATVAAIAAARVPRRVVIEASTFKLEDKEAAETALRKAGHILLDCPVSGTGIQAKTKDLVIYASGGAAEIKKLRPLFADFTREVHDLGAFGNGSKMKYIANLLVAIHNVASAGSFGARHEGRPAATAHLTIRSGSVPAIRACSNCARR